MLLRISSFPVFNKNILSVCPDFCFAIDIHIAFANADFKSISDFKSVYFTSTFASSSLHISVIKRIEIYSKCSSTGKHPLTLLENSCIM